MNMCFREKLLNILFSSSLILGDVTLALADGPALPAGSGASVPAGGASQPSGIMAFEK